MSPVQLTKVAREPAVDFTVTLINGEINTTLQNETSDSYRQCLVTAYQTVIAGAGSICLEVPSVSQKAFVVPSAVTGQSKLENGVIQLVTRKPRLCRLRIMCEAFGNFSASKSN